MRQWLGVLVTLILLTGLLVVGSGHHKPDHPTPPGQTTTTTSTSTTTTTVATTTTTAPTTTTTVPQREQISLTADWVITSPDVRSSFDVAANGFQVVIDGTTVDWDDFTIDGANRVMFHNCAGPSELTNGVVSNSGVTGQLGAYPLHWHLNYDCTRGTVVDNVTVQNGQNHAFVPHGSHGITIRNSQAFNVFEDAVWWDPPGTNREGDPDPRCQDKKRWCTLDDTHDLVLENMLVDGVNPEPGTRNPTLAAYTLGSGNGNTIRNAIARNVNQDKRSSGFKWPGFAADSVWTAENLSGDTDAWLIFTWQNSGSDAVHVVDGVTATGQGGILHGAYVNNFEYRNIDVPHMSIHAGGWRVTSGHIGQLLAQKQNKISPNDPTVLVENTTVDAFTVDNLDTSHTNTSTYILNNTGLACADVVYQSVQPGTQVIIDGQVCNA